MDLTAFDRALKEMDDGAYHVLFNRRRYLFRKETLLEGKLIKCYAEELGGNDFISLNYYPTLSGGLLKPCEMPETKVITFILGAKSL